MHIAELQDLFYGTINEYKFIPILLFHFLVKIYSGNPIFRYNGNNVQVLDKSQCHVKKDKNVIRVESKGIWRWVVSVTILTLKWIFTSG